MQEQRPSYEVHLDADPGRDPRARQDAHDAQPLAERVFRLAICGNFSGQASATGAANSADRAWRVDRDDFDDVLAAVAPTLQLELGKGMVVDVRIRELDDFHPDQLFAHVPQFERLRQLRSELADPRTFGRAAADLAAPVATPRKAVARQQGSLLDAIVGGDGPDDDAVETRTNTDSLYEFIQRAMAPHLVARTDPRQTELVAQVDGAIADAMRALLHHPAFQSLEALWRGVFRLVRHIDTDERLQVHLFDVSRQTLCADMHGVSDAPASALYARLAARASAEQGGWAVLVAHHAFGGEATDVDVLDRLAAVGAALDAPWIAEAHPDLAMGSMSPSAMDAWQRLREHEHAPYLAMAMPRVLLRLPYGSDTETIERFAFEELESADAHGSYLWGNPALFCATLLAQGFTERGPVLSTASSQLDGLPMHLVRRDGVTTVKPCAEVVMREEDANALLDAGVIPMCSLRDQDVVRVPRIQSIAEPAARLAGRLARGGEA